MKQLTQQFVQAHNKAMAITMLYNQALRHKELERSVLFHPQNVKRTLTTRSELEAMLRRANAKQPAEYIEAMQQFAVVIDDFIQLLFDTHEAGIQPDFIKYIQEFKQILTNGNDTRKN